MLDTHREANQVFWYLQVRSFWGETPEGTVFSHAFCWDVRSNMAVMRSLAKFAWGTLALNVFVILAGALVRATGSGAGCGSSWPNCDGQLVPDFGDLAQVIEYFHRSVSGLALIAVVMLAMWAFRTTSAGAPLRQAAAWSLASILGEALIGAVIVLAEWVADDASLARAISVPLHLVNTFLLLGALTMTAWIANGGVVPKRKVDPTLARHLTIGLGGMVVIAATGAVSALSDTLFPVISLAEGLTADFSQTSHLLIRLRVVHPIAAVAVGGYVAMIAYRRSLDADGIIQKYGLTVVGIVVTQIFAGMINVVLLTPIWMQVVHLLLADLLWVVFILFGLAALSDPINAEQAARESRAQVR
jgi:heme A synthase